MSRSSNSLRVSDVITTPIKLKYTSSYECDTAAEAGIFVLNGVNGPVTVTGSVNQDTLNYLSVKQLYYSNYLRSTNNTALLSGSYLSTSSSFDDSLQSSAAFGTGDADIRLFPTGSDAQVRILSIPRSVFGEQISRFGFYASSSAHIIIDDGNGNLIDATNLPYVNNQYYLPTYTDWYVYEPALHVGNIIYRQGIVIITNPNYQDIFPYPPVANSDTGSFLTTDTPKLINILANDDSGSGILVPSSVVLSGVSASLFTNNLDGTVTLNVTTPGTHSANYTVNNIISGGCSLTSNLATITAVVNTPPCNCSTYQITYVGVLPSASFTYTSCNTQNTETVTLTGANSIIQVCVCNNQISYDRRLITITSLGAGCTANCNLAGSVSFPGSTTSTTTTTTTIAPPPTTTTTTTTTTSTTTTTTTLIPGPTTTTTTTTTTTLEPAHINWHYLTYALSTWKINNTVEVFIDQAAVPEDFNSEGYAEFTGFFNAAPGLPIDVYNLYNPGPETPCIPFPDSVLSILVYDNSLPYPSNLVAAAYYNQTAPYHLICPLDSVATSFIPVAGRTYNIEIYMNTQY